MIEEQKRLMNLAIEREKAAQSKAEAVTKTEKPKEEL